MWIEKFSHSYSADISREFLVAGFRLYASRHISGNANPFPIALRRNVTAGQHPFYWLRLVSIVRVPAHWLAIGKIRPSRQRRYARSPPLMHPAWKLSRLWRTDMCLTELNWAYDRPLKGTDTEKAYRFHGNSKSAFSARCDFMHSDIACRLQFLPVILSWSDMKCPMHIVHSVLCQKISWWYIYSPCKRNFNYEIIYVLLFNYENCKSCID